MNKKRKNELVKKYLLERFVAIQKLYPGIFSYEKYDRTVTIFENSKDSFEEIKQQIDDRIKEEIEKYLQRREEGKRIALSQFQNVERTNYRTYNEIKKAYTKMRNIMDKTGVELYTAGGIVPYLLLDQNSNRLHDDIDIICRMEDMPKLREAIQSAGLYDEKWDSKNVARDGIDYGFEFKIDNVPIGIYPFSYSDNVLTQYTYDPYNQTCKTKVMPLKELGDYISKYKSVDGNIYSTQSLEVIKKSKDVTGREKDKIDSQKISEYGHIRSEVYDRLVLPIEIQAKPGSKLFPRQERKRELLNFKKNLLNAYIVNQTQQQNMQTQETQELNR